MPISEIRSPSFDLRVSIPVFRSLSFDGGVAQLGERLLCKQEVVGSIPSVSTNEYGSAKNTDRQRTRMGRAWRGLDRILLQNPKKTRQHIDRTCGFGRCGGNTPPVAFGHGEEVRVTEMAGNGTMAGTKRVGHAFGRKFEGGPANRCVPQGGGQGCPRCIGRLPGMRCRSQVLDP